MYGEYTALGEVFDVGNATSRAIMNYGRGIAPLECGGKSEYENGNGSLMRILPIAYYLYNHQELSIDVQMELIHNLSSLTHGHSRSRVGCGIYVMVAIRLIGGTDPIAECVRNGIQTAFDYYDRIGEIEIRSYNRLKRLDEFIRLPEEQIQSSGYVVHTLEAALWCLLNSSSYQECVLKAVNLGDDTDTVGAVAGGLASSFYGADQIPEEWINVIAGREYIKELCSNTLA